MLCVTNSMYASIAVIATIAIVVIIVIKGDSGGPLHLINEGVFTQVDHCHCFRIWFKVIVHCQVFPQVTIVVIRLSLYP